MTLTEKTVLPAVMLFVMVGNMQVEEPVVISNGVETVKPVILITVALVRTIVFIRYLWWWSEPCARDQSDAPRFGLPNGWVDRRVDECRWMHGWFVVVPTWGQSISKSSGFAMKSECTSHYCGRKACAYQVRVWYVQNLNIEVAASQKFHVFTKSW